MLCFVAFSFAQISEGKKTMSKGYNNALSIIVPEADMEYTQKEWITYIKGYKGKTKRQKKTGEIFTDNALILDFGGNPTDVYATFEQLDSATFLTVWFDLGGAYLSSAEHPGDYPFGEKMLFEFALNTGKKYVEAELKVVERTLVKQEKEMEKLVGTNQKLRTDIETYKQKILEAEQNITQNEIDQQSKGLEIEAQKKVVEMVRRRLQKIAN